jgi:death-on-curing protein
LSDPNWVEEVVAIAAHAEALRTFGGSDLTFNPELLGGALRRPQMAHDYGDPQPDIIELAAIYAHAICKAHAFVDGNKRTAFYVCRVFLMDNGYTFDPPTMEAYRFLLKVADDKNERITEADVAAWIRKYAKPAS